MKRALKFHCLFYILLAALFFPAFCVRASVLPAGTRIIEEEAFMGNLSLKEITIQDGVVSIGDRAFAGTGLSSVYLPASVTDFGEDVFSGIPGFYAVVEEDSAAHRYCNENHVLYHFVNLKRTPHFSCTDGILTNYNAWDAAEALDVPDFLDEQIVTGIGDGLFQGHRELKSVNLPESITTIGSNAFANTGLSSMRLPVGITFIGEGAFQNMPYGFYIIAESGSYAEYYCTENGIPCRVHQPYPETPHPCVYYEDYSCNYTYPVDAAWLRVTFSEETATPGECEGISIRNSNGKTIRYSGYQLAGKTLFLPGNRFTITWDCDGFEIYEEEVYGFAITNIVGLTQKEASAPYFKIDHGYIRDYAFAEPISDLIIPDIVDGQWVNGIDANTFAHHAEITRVTLPEGLKSIGYMAFFYCTGLQSITFPEGMTSIESYAFNNCTALQSAAFPESLISIGNNAFSGCSKLEELRITGNLKEIGSYAFSHCKGLRTVSLPEGLTRIGGNAFWNCSALNRIHLPETVTDLGTYLLDGCTSLTDVMLPADLDVLSVGLFRNCSSLQSIVLPESMTKIGISAFENCVSLTEISLPAGTVRIDNSAFKGCRSLGSIYLPAGLTQLGDSVFAGCTGMTGIYAAEENSVFSSVDGILFDKSQTEILICPGGVRGIFTIPSTMTEIGEYVFHGCSGLTGVIIPGSISRIGKAAFKDCTGLQEIQIPGSVVSIGESAFEGCSGLQQIVIPETLNTLGKAAFRNCTGVEELTILSRNTDIGPYSFEGCSSLEEIQYPAGITSIAEGMFQNTGLREIILPDTVTSIGNYAFCGCYGQNALTIAGNVVSIGEYAFAGCDGVREVTISGNVKHIDAYAFSWCSSLYGATISGSVENIDEYAFAYCSSLEWVSLSEGLAEIGCYAFAGCPYLCEIIVPDSVEYIGDYAFLGQDPETLELLVPYFAMGYYEEFKPENLPTIYGNTGTEAESYADSYDYPFASRIPGPPLIRSVTWSEQETRVNIFFEQFDNFTYYILYGSNDPSGPYKPVDQTTTSRYGCEVISTDLTPGENRFYCILGSNYWTTPFSPQDYSMNFLYERITGGIRILGIYALEDLTEVTIPDTIDGLMVLEIEKDAFKPFINLTKITLPNWLENAIGGITKPAPETEIVVPDPSSAENFYQQSGRRLLESFTTQLNLEPEQLVSTFYVDEMHQNELNYWVDLAQNILNEQYEDIVFTEEKKKEYLLLQALEYLAAEDVSYTYPKIEWNEQHISNYVKGELSAVEWFGAMFTDLWEGLAQDKDEFTSLFDNFVEGRLSEEGAMEQLTVLLNRNGMLDDRTGFMTYLKEFRVAKIIADYYEAGVMAAELYDKIIEGINTWHFVESINKDVLEETGRIYQSSDDAVIRAVGRDLVFFAAAPEYNKIVQVVMTELGGFFRKVLEKAASAVKDSQLNGINAFTVTVKLGSVFGNVLTGANLMAGLKDKVEWSVEAVDTTFAAYQRAKERYLASPGDENLYALYRAQQTYYGAACSAEDSLLNIYKTIKSSLTGDLTINADYALLMDQLEDIVKSLKRSAALTRISCSLWQDGDWETFSQQKAVILNGE